MTRTVGTRTFATAAEARQFQAAQWSEAHFQTMVMGMARRLGWRCYHTHDSRRSAPGFPDLVLVHPAHGVMYRELKRAKGGRVSPEQREWLDLLTTAGQDAGIWKPQDYLDDTIRTQLTRKGQ